MKTEMVNEELTFLTAPYDSNSLLSFDSLVS